MVNVYSIDQRVYKDVVCGGVSCRPAGRGPGPCRHGRRRAGSSLLVTDPEAVRMHRRQVLEDLGVGHAYDGVVERPVVVVVGRGRGRGGGAGAYGDAAHDGGGE